jgi:ribonucleoside-diphosphate reductase alpha chain
MAIATDMYPQISQQSEIILQHRYYLKDEDHNLIENAHGLFQRVAEAIARVDSEWYAALPVEVDLLANEFYDMMTMFEFLPNSPTLMNAGTNQGTLSACFVLPLEDSMEGIMQAATHSAMVQKFGGGTGFALSKLRPKGAAIKSTHGIACGPIEVLKTLSRVSSMITQGGKRDGANMAVMSVYHPDIKEFIYCKSTEGDIHNFNISVAVDSNFMTMVETGVEYPLIDPHTNQVVQWENARDIFNAIVYRAWANGEPGMVFLDRINADNQVGTEFGDMVATNPCGEQPLLGNESCNLGSINLARFYYKGNTSDWRECINWSRLTKVINLSVHFLDNVIDANKYAVLAIQEMTQATRKIGLGVMGFADLLVQLKVPYNSKEALEIGAELMQFIRTTADIASLNLGGSRGPFPAWSKSNYRMHENYRNACRVTVAPTGTISMIASCASGIEPLFALVWQKQNILEGKTLYYVNASFEQIAKEEGFYSDTLMNELSNGKSLDDFENVPLWVKQVYITAPQISAEAHVAMQAAFQPWVDSGISKTINFAHDATLEDVQVAYMEAWKLGCKGITIYRNGSRAKEVLVNGHTEVNCGCDDPMIVAEGGCVSCKKCGWSACAIS